MEDSQRILVVDDEKTLCDVLKLNLELEGYKVDVTYSAEEAQRMPLSSYSLILLDVMMEEMTGIELTTIIRADERTRNVPIILCTAKDDENDIIDGFMCGADDYITSFHEGTCVEGEKCVASKLSTKRIERTKD